jgi:hypothetical protein
MSEPLNIPELNNSQPSVAQSVAPAPAQPLDIPELHSEASAAPLDIPELRDSSNKAEQPSVLSQFDAHKLSELQKLKMSSQAMWTGVLHFGSTLAKAVGKTNDTLDKAVGGLPKAPLQFSAKDVQDYYNKQVETLSNNKKNYPDMHLGIPEFAGSLAPMLIPAGGIASKAGELGEAAGSLFGAPNIGKMAGEIAGNTATNTALSSLYNSYGQDPNQILNPDSAQTGAKWGLGAGLLSAGIGKYGEGLQQFTKYVDDLRGAGYAGKVLPRDVPGQGAINSMLSRMANSVLDFLPGIFGTSGLRQGQLEAFKPALVNFLTGMSQKDAASASLSNIQGALRDAKQTSQQVIKNQLNRAAAKLNSEESYLWNVGLKGTAEDAGLTSINLPQTTQDAAAILSSYGSRGNNVLGGKTEAFLKGITNDTSLDDFLSTRRDLWTHYEKLRSAGNASIDTKDAASAVRDLYWTITNDFKNSTQNYPAVSEAFEHANAFSKGAKQLLDPENNPYLANAIEKMKVTSNALKNYIGWMTGGKPDYALAQQNANFIGKAAVDEMGKIQLNDLLTKSLSSDGTKINLNTWLSGLKNLQGSTSSLLSKSSLDAMEGLTNFMQERLAAQSAKAAPATAGGMFKAAIGGTALTGLGLLGLAQTEHPHMSSTGALVAATPIALNIISRSPLKNILMYLNKAANNPNMSQYLMQNVSSKLMKSGLIMQLNDDDNQLVLKHQTENEKK